MEHKTHEIDLVVNQINNDALTALWKSLIEQENHHASIRFSLSPRDNLNGPGKRRHFRRTATSSGKAAEAMASKRSAVRWPKTTRRAKPGVSRLSPPKKTVIRKDGCFLWRRQVCVRTAGSRRAAPRGIPLIFFKTKRAFFTASERMIISRERNRPCLRRKARR